MTLEESHVLEKLGEAWNAFIALPPLHPHDADEYMRAIHAAQNIILAREGLRAMAVEREALGACASREQREASR